MRLASTTAVTVWIATMVTAVAANTERTDSRRQQPREQGKVIRLQRAPEGLQVPEWRGEALWSTVKDSSMWFANLVGGAFVGDESLVAGYGGFELAAITRNASRARAIGRQGDGPGEFRWIFSIGGLQSAGLFVYDWKLRRLTRYSKTGSLASTRTLSSIDLDGL